MNDERNDGGPAFPQSETAKGNTVENEHGQGGMSLRDYFAGKAMHAIIGNQAQFSGANTAAEKAYEGDDLSEKSRIVRQIVASMSYAVADAMLAARKK